jgi:hypothetical protein
MTGGLRIKCPRAIANRANQPLTLAAIASAQLRRQGDLGCDNILTWTGSYVEQELYQLNTLLIKATLLAPTGL